MGKALILAGLILVCAGVVVWSGVGKGWMGRLAGAIHYTKGDFSVHLPIVTCLLIGLILTAVFGLFRK